MSRFTQRFLMLLWISLPALASPPTTISLSGVVGEVKKTDDQYKILFRTSDANYILDAKKLSSDVLKQLTSENAQQQIVGISIPKAAILINDPVPMGIRSDCSELPLKLNDLTKITSSSGVKTQEDFLKSIPPGTLQGFTLVYDSQSVQKGEKNKEGKGEVSPQWPRVIRTSIDGKLTMSYVCDPNNPTYGTVEVLSFDDDSKSFKATEYDFRDSTNPPPSRVHTDPTSCASCHSASSVNGKPSLKPNWPEYFFWADYKHGRGISIYGSSDDNMGNYASGEPFFRDRSHSEVSKIPEGATDALDLAAHKEEQANFKNFKKDQQSNPCYSTLPWAKIPEGREKEDPYKAYSNYPYANQSQAPTRNGKPDYSLRTNLRMTTNYSRLNAKRVAGRITSSPDYPIIQYYLAMEQSGCLMLEDIAELKDLMPDLQVENETERSYSSYKPDAKGLLYAYAKKIGIKDEDWSLEFKKPGSSYNAAVSGEGGGDLQMVDIVGGNLVADLGSKNSALGIDSESITHGTSQNYGQEFSCLDRLGGALSGKLKGNPEAYCTTLHSENKKHIDFLKKTGQCGKVASKTEELQKDAKNAILVLDAQSIERGRNLAGEHGKANCVKCHSPTNENKDDNPKDFLFLPSESLDAKANADAKSVLKSRMEEGFADQIKNRVKTLGDMPPGSKNLSDQDRQDILNYIQSLK